MVGVRLARFVLRRSAEASKLTNQVRVPAGNYPQAPADVTEP